MYVSRNDYYSEPTAFSQISQKEKCLIPKYWAEECNLAWMNRRFLVSIVAILISFASQGQIHQQVSLTDFVKDVQQWKKEDDKMRLAWWLPGIYWEIALADHKQIPPGTIQQIQTALGDYVVICAADISINSDGSIDFTQDGELRKTITLYDMGGNAHLPLPDDDISPEAKALAESLKPVFTQAIGQLGKGMHIYFFTVKDDKKNNLIDEMKKGEFKIVHSDNEFKWNLPLATLLPQKLCPTDNEKMMGNWS